MALNLLYTKPGHLARRFEQIAVAIFMEETADFNITPVQYAILVALRENPAIDATALSQGGCRFENQMSSRHTGLRVDHSRKTTALQPSERRLFFAIQFMRIVVRAGFARATFWNPFGHR